MDEWVEYGVCPVCGRKTLRWCHSWTLGRKDSMPVRAFDRWRHQDDNTLACEQTDG